MKKKFNIDLTVQNKLIITALIISTALIVSIAFWAVNRIKIELDESYRSFGQLLTKTLAVQNFEITQAKNGTNAVKDLLDNNSKAFTSTNITYDSLFDFYSHINDNLKYKIKKTLRILEDYRIIEDLPCYIGIFKNEDGERYEAPISNQ